MIRSLTPCTPLWTSSPRHIYNKVLTEGTSKLAGAMELGVASETHPPLTLPPTEDERRRIRQHLEVLLTDPLFNNSKRLPAFLRYVVKDALEGNHEGQIKERTLGIVVFGRPNDYDTNADPVVRMTAGEVRKKLAQYYYANQDADVQIEVPLGSYMPRFRFSHSDVSPASAAPLPLPAMPLETLLRAQPVVIPTPAAQRWSGWKRGYLAALLVLLLSGFGAWRILSQQTSVDHFWKTFSNPSKQVLIVLPALSRVPQQPVQPYRFEAESVAIEDAEVASRISSEFRLRNFNSHLVLATAASLSDLRSSPFVLIGALDNVWIMRLSQSLPFAFERSEDRRYGSIVDRKDRSLSWTQDFGVPNANIKQDYGIVARFTDPTTDQPTVLIAGISAEGTLAAGEAVTTPRYLDMLLKAAGNPANGFEAVIETRVIDGRSGPPRVVQMRTW
jgi:hypothetical protein